MNRKPITNFALSTALWLTMLPAFSYAQEILPNTPINEQAQIFLNAGSLTSVKPLMITFHPQQILLAEENMEILKKWLKRVAGKGVPIHIYSYATPPMSRRDMSEKSAQHRALRKAFNRALEAKNAIESEGISSTLIALHAIGTNGDNPSDQLRITIRKE